jgi:hypothetical protein
MRSTGKGKENLIRKFNMQRGYAHMEERKSCYFREFIKIDLKNGATCSGGVGTYDERG